MGRGSGVRWRASGGDNSLATSGCNMLEVATTDFSHTLLSETAAEEVLQVALSRGADFAEIFAEDRRSCAAGFDDQKIEELASGRSRGAGIRVLVGDSTGFAHTADLSPQGLKEAAEVASAAARDGQGQVKQIALTQAFHPNPSDPEILPETVPKAHKVEMLARVDQIARSAGSEISQVSCRYGDSRRQFVVANSDGVYSGDDQVKSSFSVSCVAVGDGGMQTGRESIGHTVGFELFERYDVEDLAEKAATRALTKLKAQPAPSGTMPVVIGQGGGGVLFHEACGHGLEADHIAKNASVFVDRIGEQVASPLVTLIDDGTMTDEWGCYAIDDEGRPAQHTVLIKDGILVDYMWDLIRARQKSRPSSGNGRRQSYQHLPMVRMTNTYISNGSTDPEKIIADTPEGVYVAQLGGGQVNPATGDFVFGMTEAYLIRNGEIAEPLREGNLIGNGPEVLQNIDLLGSDFAMGSPGACGKDGQGVPVGDGTPTLRVTALTVGGTAA